MTLRRSSIIACIEELRQEMYTAMSSHGLESSQTLLASQKLDVAINEYYKMKRNANHVETAAS